MRWQVGVVIAAIMQGGLIVGFRLLAKKVSGRLNDNENWKTEAQYATAFYSKLFAFGCINSYSALFFFAFMSNDFNWFGLLDFDLSCPGRDCFPYVGLLAVTLFVQLCIIKCLPQMGAFFTKYLSTNGSDETDDAPTPSKGCKCTKCMKRELSGDEKAAEISMLLPSFQCQLTKDPLYRAPSLLPSLSPSAPPDPRSAQLMLPLTHTMICSFSLLLALTHLTHDPLAAGLAFKDRTRLSLSVAPLDSACDPRLCLSPLSSAVGTHWGWCMLWGLAQHWGC